MLKVNYHKIRTQKNSEFNNAFISDIHYDSRFCPILEKNIITNIKKVNPDYICITGDIINGIYVFDSVDVEKNLVSFLTKLSEIAKLFIILGSHDLEIVSSPSNNFGKYLKKWKSILKNKKNIYLLDNEKYEDDLINIIGVTLPFEYYHKLPYENVNIIVDELNNKKYQIENKQKYNLLLIHSPRRIITNKSLKKIRILQDIDLVLCGHMHGGVIPKFINKIPTTVGLVSPQKTLFPKYTRGKCSKTINGHKINLIITGGITKLASKYIKFFNFLYDHEIEYIEIGKNDGKIYN